MNTGGPAFPVPEDENAPVHDGMTLRDYFAGLAMQGTLAGRKGSLQGISKEQVESIARDSYKFADAMIRERDEHE